jgi:hypothetical protein
MQRYTHLIKVKLEKLLIASICLIILLNYGVREISAYNDEDYHLNTIVNPEFETGDLSCWTIFGEGIISVGTINPNSGSYSVYLGDGLAIIEQEVSLYLEYIEFYYYMIQPDTSGVGIPVIVLSGENGGQIGVLVFQGSLNNWVRIYYNFQTGESENIVFALCPTGSALFIQEVNVGLDGFGQTEAGYFDDFYASAILSGSVAPSLFKKYEFALNSFDRGNDMGGLNILNALIHQVDSLRGRKITEKEADGLTAYANKIIYIITNF